MRRCISAGAAAEQRTSCKQCRDNPGICAEICDNIDIIDNIQSVSKKMVFCGKTAITSFKLIQNAKSGGVLENSGYLLRYGH